MEKQPTIAEMRKALEYGATYLFMLAVSRKPLCSQVKKLSFMQPRRKPPSCTRAATELEV